MNQVQESPSSSSRKNRSAKSLLLDKKFQLKYTGMIVSVTALLSAVLGGFLYSKVRENSRMLDLEALEDSGFASQLHSVDNELVVIIGASLFSFMVVITVLSILITHRMAGPIYVMKRHLTTLAEGRLPTVRALRKGDEFVDCHEALLKVVSGIEKRTGREVSVLARAIDGLSSSDVPQMTDIKAELEHLLAEKRSVLADKSS